MSTSIFVKNIQEWVKLDNTIKQINGNLKEIKNKKNVLEKDIITFASSNNLNNKVLNINETKLGFSVNTTYPSISIKLLTEVLEETLQDSKGVQIILDLLSKKRMELSKNTCHIKRK
jgi:hypothetical protein